MCSNTKYQLKRKIFHLLGLIYPLIVFLVNSQITAVVLATTWATILTALEIIKLKNKRCNTLFSKVFGPILKEEEKTGFSSALWMALGVASTVCLIQDAKLATTILIIAITGDAGASITGVLFSRKFNDKKERKTLTGLMGFFCTALACSALLSPYTGIGPNSITLICLCLCGAVLEYIKTPLDDNLQVPIGTSLCYLCYSYLILPYYS